MHLFKTKNITRILQIWGGITIMILLPCSILLAQSTTPKTEYTLMTDTASSNIVIDFYDQSVGVQTKLITPNDDIQNTDLDFSLARGKLRTEFKYISNTINITNTSVYNGAISDFDRILTKSQKQITSTSIKTNYEAFKKAVQAKDNQLSQETAQKVKEALYNSTTDSNKKEIQKLTDTFDTIQSYVYGPWKMLPPIEISFDTLKRNGTEGVYISRIRDIQNNKDINILEMVKLAQTHTIDILKGSSTIDGTAYNTSSQKAKIHMSDITDDVIEIHLYDSSNEINTIYDGRGTGVQKLQEGKIKGLIETDNKDVLFAKIINFALSFVGVIAVIMLIYAGFQYIIAMGNSEKTDSSRDIIIYSIIGIIIIISAYTITNTVLNLTGNENEQFRIEFKLGSSILIGATLERNDCLYTGSVIGSVQICNQDNFVMIKTPIVNTGWPIEEARGVCKNISIFSACIDEEI